MNEIVGAKRVSDLLSDQRNANRGTKRGGKMVAQSLRDYGAGRSIVIDKNGRIICGNKTAEHATDAGLTDVIVVKTDGTQLVAVQRTDLDLSTDAKAKELAVADNRASELSLSWDSDVLKSFTEEIDLSKFWDDKELQRLFDHVPSDEPAYTSGYAVMIEGISEAQQLALLERLTAEGLKCRALTF